jgi:hypothetical protein
VAPRPLRDLPPGYLEWSAPVGLEHAIVCLWAQVTPDGGPRPTADSRSGVQPMSFQTMADSWSIVSMPYCSVGFPVVSTAIR